MVIGCGPQFKGLKRPRRHLPRQRGRRPRRWQFHNKQTRLNLNLKSKTALPSGCLIELSGYFREKSRLPSRKARRQLPDRPQLNYAGQRPRSLKPGW